MCFKNNKNVLTMNCSGECRYLQRRCYLLQQFIDWYWLFYNSFNSIHRWKHLFELVGIDFKSRKETGSNCMVDFFHFSVKCKPTQNWHPDVQDCKVVHIWSERLKSFL